MSLLNKQKEAAEPDVSTFPVSQAVRSSPRVISRGDVSPGALGLKPVLHDKDTAAPALFGSYLHTRRLIPGFYFPPQPVSLYLK